MDTKEIESILKENNNFVESIIAKKYLQDDEHSLQDIKERFRRILKDKTDFSDVDYFVDEMLFNTFIPGGSILFGLGSNKKVSMSNCYYIPIEQDSIEGIGKAIAKNMKVFSWRGGVGNSFEILRPKDTKVDNASRTSSGSVSFMPLFSNATQTIGQNGRRGASIFTHAIWHPDVEDFIKSKSNPEEVFERDALNNTLPKITGANISVKLTKAFMEAVEKDADWDLVFPDVDDPEFKNWDGDLSVYKGKLNHYKTVKAKELMKQIAYSAWSFAEPGVSFWDTVIDHTPMSVIERLKPRGLNPCGEEILANYDSCNLGALVLHNFVKNPFTEDAYFDFTRFSRDVAVAVEFMDIILDLNKHPLEEQTEVNKYGRKIGLGITGLADMLAMLNVDYGNDESLAQVKNVMLRKALFETKASLELAKRKGACPALQDETNRLKFAKHKYFQNLFKQSKEDLNLEQDMIKYGLRNISLSTIAPTGTISIVMDNCTSGIEPLFMFEYTRKSNLIDKDVRIIHPTLFNYLVKNKPEDLDLDKDQLLKKYHYVESHALDYKQRLKMQSICQEFTTDSISSTVNLPNSTTVDDIFELYIMAHKLNLKGVTVYRDGCNLGGILQSTEKTTDSEDEEVEIPLVKEGIKDLEEARRYRVRWKNNIKTYITVTVRKDEDGIRPLEIFTKVPKEAGLEKGNFNSTLFLERQGYWDSMCRLLSLDLRYNIPLEEIIKQLDGSAYAMYDLPSILRRILVKFLPTDKKTTEYETCPECGEKTLIRQGGCYVCTSCGYSKCE